jgi:hypothetical protein
MSKQPVRPVTCSARDEASMGALLSGYLVDLRGAHAAWRRTHPPSGADAPGGHAFPATVLDPAGSCASAATEELESTDASVRDYPRRTVYCDVP